MAKLYHPTYKTKTGERKPLKKWYVFLDGREIPLSTNRRAAEAMLGELLKKAEYGKSGLSDPFEQHRKKPLAVHLAAWQAVLRSGDGGEKHAAEMVRCVTRMVGGCLYFADLTPAVVRHALADLKKPKDVATLPAGRDHFTRNELAALLNVTPASVPDLVKRHGLAATGNGKARRYPRETAEALLARRGEGASTTTLNRHLQAVKMFTKWMTDEKRAADNPLAAMKRVGNPEHDRRREFATLTTAEITSLITSARDSAAEFMGMAGTDRAAVYLCAVATAFRPVELSRLTPADFLLDGAAPLVRLDGTRTKNGQTAEQHVTPAVAAELREYVATRPAGEPVWPGDWFTKGADMIRIDLPAASIPPTKPAAGGGELVVSLYSLRHSVPALLESNGATLREVMTHMRHSTPTLTMKTYGRLGRAELAAVAGKMPTFAADIPQNIPPTSPRTDSERGFLRTVEETTEGRAEGVETAEVLGMKAFDEDQEVLKRSEDSSPGWIRTNDQPINSRLLYR